jgi:hypothetical protein
MLYVVETVDCVQTVFNFCHRVVKKVCNVRERRFRSHERDGTYDESTERTACLVCAYLTWIWRVFTIFQKSTRSVECLERFCTYVTQGWRLRKSVVSSCCLKVA